MKPPEPRFFPENHSEARNFLSSPFLFVIVFLLLQIPETIAAQIPLEYIKHCDDVVPASTAEPSVLSSMLASRKTTLIVIKLESIK
ncbi:hypothetical protein V6N11_063772 [Hibiscus sabdariffa]|uniref:Uncharacterized protein n=1 Tax=Hibiscus sabdariffa TaxID=183260 RepID=A0ABR2PMD4_9ROSI